MSHYIFDFDGVLARTLEDEIRVYRATTETNETDEEIIQHHREWFSRPRFGRRNNLSEEQIQSTYEYLHKHGDHVIGDGNNTLFKDVLNTIPVMQGKKAIVSTATEKVILHLLQEYLPNFEYIYGADTSLSKETKIEKIAKNWGVEPHQCVYFTDTLSDTLELSPIMGVKNIIGCGWGWSGVADLKKELPEEQILQRQSDFRNLFVS